MTRPIGSSLIFTALLALGGPGCDSGSSAGSEGAPAQVQAQAGTQARAPFELKGADGQVLYAFEPYEEGYRLRNASGKAGKLKVEADRVKLKGLDGETKIKVKVKDYGFKVYGADDVELYKAKRKGAGYKIVRVSDEAELGRSDTDSAEFGGAQISATAGDAGIEIKRGGELVASVSGSVPTKAAVFLGATELEPDVRAAIVAFVANFP